MRKRKMLRTTTLLISILVIATLSVSTYLFIYRNLSAYDKQLDVMQKDLLINFQTKADEALDSATREISTWMLEDSVIRFATEEKHDYYNAQKISEKVARESVLFYNVDCIYGVFRPDLDIFITNKGILHCEHFEKGFDFVPNSRDMIKSIPEQEFVNNFYLSDDFSSGYERVNLFFRRNPPGENDITVYGVVSLNLKQLTEQISQQHNSSFYAFKDEDCFFSSAPEKKIRRMKQLDEHSELVHNLTYSIATEQRSSVMLWFVCILLLLVLVCAGLYGSFILARFLHRPIENILKQVSDDDEAEIYDEEVYISRRFVEIKNVNEKLAEQMNAQEQYLKQNFIRDLLYGMVTEEALKEKGGDYGLVNLSGAVVLALLEENNNEAQGTVYAGQITALLSTKVADSTVVFLNPGQVAVIAGGISYKEFKTAIAQSVLQIDEWYGVSYTGAISDGELKTPLELSHLFNDAMRYLQNGDFSYEKLIITKEDLFEREEYSYYYPLEFEKNIITSIAGSEFGRAMQIVQMILDKNLVEMKLNKAALTELKFAFVGTVKRVLHVLKKTEAEVFGEGSVLYLELSACRTPEEVSKKIMEMFSVIRMAAEDAYDCTNSALIDQLEAYIRDNYYREEISLFFLAEQFNITSGYISRVFKKYRDINFKDYLSAYRIQKATEILEMTPDIRVADLAQRVGYDNVQRFVRNFKKLKNVSPGEYKKQK